MSLRLWKVYQKTAASNANAKESVILVCIIGADYEFPWGLMSFVPASDESVGRECCAVDVSDPKSIPQKIITPIACSIQFIRSDDLLCVPREE